jgi:hypothetical protein
MGGTPALQFYLGPTTYYLEVSDVTKRYIYFLGLGTFL